jgi:hypothetical protein
MAFTDDNDINILQASDSEIVGAGLGDDIYIVTPVLMTAGQVVTLSDVDGTNTLQLVDGLIIASSIVASNARQLTLNNGTIINVNGADTFNFNVGGNVTAGIAGEDKGFSDFAQDVLNVTVPAEGADPVSVEDEVEIGADEGGGGDPPDTVTDVDIDTATFPTQTDFDGSGDAYNFIDDASVSNYAIIDNFSADDTISFVNADVNDYAFSNDGEDVTLSYNYNDEGTMNVIELTGVVSSDVFVYDLSSFTDAVGFDAFG